jgi:hypothetical protein
MSDRPDVDISDDELTALALAASPDPLISADAVPIWDVIESDGGPVLLPEWYQPGAMRRSVLLHGWRRRVALVTIVAFIAIDAFGLCSTYGHIVFA